jgi:hypothetical protein
LTLVRFGFDFVAIICLLAGFFVPPKPKFFLFLFMLAGAWLVSL